MLLNSLFSAFASEGYDWNEFNVFRHPVARRKFVVDTDGGCSCNTYEGLSEADAAAMTPLTKREVYAAFSKWWDNTTYSNHHGTKVDNLERLRSSL